MYLSELSIKGYRCFKNEFKIPFSSGLNVIVGENGAGKTAIIGAIRQLFRDSESAGYFVSEDDFYRGFETDSQAEEFFSVRAGFSELGEKERVALLGWTSGKDEAHLNLQVDNRETRGRYRRVVWGGNARSAQFDSEVLDLIHCIYLPPLRDAESQMNNGRQSRLSKLLRALNKRELKKNRVNGDFHPLEERFKTFNQEMANSDDLSIKRANELIREHLTAAIGVHFGQNTAIQFAESDFSRIVEGLRLLFFPEQKNVDQNLFRSLSQNSLGYNNLLYIASILAELTLIEDNDEDSSIFRVLLIEEPEAHLHPQLQMRLLNHLKSVSENADSKVQVIVTTHSTVLASSVDIDAIIHLSKKDTLKATALSNCGLQESSKNFVNRWLDVTKSNLLFANGVILVEGIAEQILLPVLAKIVLKNEADGKRTMEDLGVSAINLNGIYFKHFMQLYCNITDPEDKSVSSGINIPIKCAGITDLDPPKKYEGEDFIPNDRNLVEGTNHAIKLTPSINNSEYARLYVSKYKTLEYDLAMTGNNIGVMSSVIAAIWPKPKSGESAVINDLLEYSTEDWSGKDSTERSIVANKILKWVDSNDVGKGLFAQVLAEKIELNKIDFTVPEYIENAILWACSIDRS